jgi:hypothetical protein
MPYQSLASLSVIIAMFNVVPALNSGVQALAYGVRSFVKAILFCFWLGRLFVWLFVSFPWSIQNQQILTLAYSSLLLSSRIKPNRFMSSLFPTQTKPTIEKEGARIDLERMELPNGPAWWSLRGARCEGTGGDGKEQIIVHFPATRTTKIQTKARFRSTRTRNS